VIPAKARPASRALVLVTVVWGCLLSWMLPGLDIVIPAHRKTI
jgi:hypothetical protein